MAHSLADGFLQARPEDVRHEPLHPAGLAERKTVDGTAVRAAVEPGHAREEDDGAAPSDVRDVLGDCLHRDAQVEAHALLGGLEGLLSGRLWRLFSRWRAFFRLSFPFPRGPP